jgi:isocitrate dehydrogenase
MLMNRAAIAAASLRAVARTATTTSTGRRSAAAAVVSAFPGRFGDRYPLGTAPFRQQQVCWMSTEDLNIPPPPTSHHPHKSLPGAQGKIIYTETDEAPALATYSLYPAVNKIGSLAGIDIIPCDISVAGRVLALFPEKLKPSQRVPDNLAYLGALAKTPEANIIKLPNISAPLNQLEDCIAELRSKGYDVPLYPREPQTEEDFEIQKKYQSVMGSAVNPVLREGNSDRRVAPPVKAYAQKNPHRMGIWSKASRTHVAHMSKGDFYSSERSAVMGNEPTSVRIEFTPKDGGETTVLKEKIPLEAGEVIDASFLSVNDLKDFYEAEIEDAKTTETLFSLHLKATMMKVSDPIMFGHCIKVFYKNAFDKHGSTLEQIGANPNQGLGSIFEAVKNKCDEAKAKEILNDFEACYEDRPWLAMVDSERGITNLHAPNDIIIDASMPVVIRDSGKMWNKLGVSNRQSWRLELRHDDERGLS